MIRKNINLICEDYKSIENYEIAINSPKMYDIHHRNEIIFDVTSEQLKDMGLYYHRPPEELIFLTRSELKKVHRDQISRLRIKNKLSAGKRNPRYRTLCPVLLYTEYIVNKKTGVEIQQIFNIGRRTVWRKLKEYNIPIKDKGVGKSYRIK